MKVKIAVLLSGGKELLFLNEKPNNSYATSEKAILRLKKEEMYED